MTRNEILDLSEDKLLKMVHKNFGVKLSGLGDTENMSFAWEIVEILIDKGWGIHLMRNPDVIKVDCYKFDGGLGTIFAQYGYSPNFSSIVEGICKTALIALTANEKPDLQKYNRMP
jgi:hypothetical protein